MSLESLIPMVNRWLEGVNIAMDDNALDRIDGDGEDSKQRNSPPGQRRASFLSHCQRNNALLASKTSKKYLDVNQNEDDNDFDQTEHARRSYSIDDLSRIKQDPDSELLTSKNFLSCNFSHLKRESIDSTYVQRPFSPSPSLPSSDLSEEDIILLSPQFGPVLSQRRASDGMLLPRVSDSDPRSLSSRPSSRYGLRPSTPASASRRIQKSNSSLQLPPISINSPSECPGELLQSIDMSDNGGTTPTHFSGSEKSCDEERAVIFPTPPQTPRSSENKSPITSAGASLQPLLARRRGSLPNVLTPVRPKRLPSLREENIAEAASISAPFPPAQSPTSINIRRRAYRSKSLPCAGLGSLNDWNSFKARKAERGEKIDEQLLNLPGISKLNDFQ